MCQFHPRSKAIAVCSVCGIGLCGRCVIEDRGNIYCDGCYAASDTDELVHAEHTVESDDYIDLELMDLIDSDDDDGLF
jgi:hypothetical protein